MANISIWIKMALKGIIIAQMAKKSYTIKKVNQYEKNMINMKSCWTSSAGEIEQIETGTSLSCPLQ